MVVVVSSNCQELARNIADLLAMPIIVAECKKFTYNELFLSIVDNINLKTQDIIIVASASGSANDNLMELLLLARLVRAMGARQIIVVMPYLYYSRQDSALGQGASQVNLIADLIKIAGIDKLITLDLHSSQCERAFKISVQNLATSGLFARALQEYFSKLNYAQADLIVVAPDSGGKARAASLAQLMGIDLALVNKARDKNNNCSVVLISGDVKNKHCIIIDDIVDTGKTLVKARELLLAYGAKSVSACVTHGIFSGLDATMLVSLFEVFYITNTIRHNNLLEKVRVLDVSGLIVDALS